MLPRLLRPIRRITRTCPTTIEMSGTLNEKRLVPNTSLSNAMTYPLSASDERVELALDFGKECFGSLKAELEDEFSEARLDVAFALRSGLG